MLIITNKCVYLIGLCVFLISIIYNSLYYLLSSTLKSLYKIINNYYNTLVGLNFQPTAFSVQCILSYRSLKPICQPLFNAIHFSAANWSRSCNVNACMHLFALLLIIISKNKELHSI